MNVLTNLDKWRIVDGVDGKYINADAVIGEKTTRIHEKILRIDFNKRLVETDKGYYELGDEHK